jgi:pyruvate/2-oxoglutarate dehydrogenase complex dihydrolipoamide acyltransferase (E2) component
LDRSTGKPFTEPGLWGLLPGTATNGGTGALWFTSGINHEQDGLLGVLRP